MAIRPLYRLAFGFVAALALLVALVFGLGSTGSAQDNRPSGYGSGVVREVLAVGQPQAAPGYDLLLTRITIEPGTTLATHVHPGMQIAHIASGVLTYHVVDGEAPIHRATTNGTPGPVEMVAAGGMTELRPGDWVVEVEGMVHYAENLGDEPVEIYLSSLFEEGEPASIVIDATPTA